MPIEPIQRASIRNDQIVDSVMTRVIPRLNEVIEAVNQIEARLGRVEDALKALDAPRRFEMDFSKPDPHAEMHALTAPPDEADDESEDADFEVVDAGEAVQEPAPAPPSDEADVLALFDGLSSRIKTILARRALSEGWTVADVLARSAEDWRIHGVIGVTSAETIYEHLHGA